MVKPDHLTLDSLMSRKGYTGEVRHSSTAQQSTAIKKQQYSTQQHPHSGLAQHGLNSHCHMLLEVARHHHSASEPITAQPTKHSAAQHSRVKQNAIQ